MYRRPRLCGSSLDFEFIRECTKIYKIRPKFHFLTKIEIKWLTLCFCFVIYCLLASRAIWKPFYRSTFTWHLRFWVVLTITNFLWLAKSNEFPQSLGHVCCISEVLYGGRIWTDFPELHVNFIKTIPTTNSRASFRGFYSLFPSNFWVGTSSYINTIIL